MSIPSFVLKLCEGQKLGLVFYFLVIFQLILEFATYILTHIRC